LQATVLGTYGLLAGGAVLCWPVRIQDEKDK